MREAGVYDGKFGGGTKRAIEALAKPDKQETTE